MHATAQRMHGCTEVSTGQHMHGGLSGSSEYTLWEAVLFFSHVDQPSTMWVLGLALRSLALIVGTLPC